MHYNEISLMKKKNSFTLIILGYEISA